MMDCQCEKDRKVPEKETVSEFMTMYKEAVKRVKRGCSNMVCPKCRGNIFFDRETSYSYLRQQNEWTGWCLQCGYTIYLREETTSENTVASGRRNK